MKYFQIDGVRIGIDYSEVERSRRNERFCLESPVPVKCVGPALDSDAGNAVSQARLPVSRRYARDHCFDVNGVAGAVGCCRQLSRGGVPIQ